MSVTYTRAKKFSISEKLQAIHRVAGGESKKAVSRDIGVSESTLRGWCKNEVSLRALVNRYSLAYHQQLVEEPREAKRRRVDEEALQSPAMNGCQYAQQQQQFAAPFQSMEEALSSGWFKTWRNLYDLQQPPEEESLQPLSLVTNKPRNVYLNLNNNVVNVEKQPEEMLLDVVGTEDEENNPPETAEEALRHGKLFLRWLERTTHSNVTVDQLAQFRSILNIVKCSTENGSAATQ